MVFYKSKPFFLFRDNKTILFDCNLVYKKRYFNLFKNKFIFRFINSYINNNIKLSKKQKPNKKTFNFIKPHLLFNKINFYINNISTNFRRFRVFMRILKYKNKTKFKKKPKTVVFFKKLLKLNKKSKIFFKIQELYTHSINKNIYKNFNIYKLSCIKNIKGKFKLFNFLNTKNILKNFIISAVK
jgi:hypothetical protein